MNQHTSLPNLTSKVHPFISLQPPSLQGYLSLTILLHFLLMLYIPSWLGQVFKFMISILLKNAIGSHKIGSRFFSLTLCPAKFSHWFLLSPPWQSKITHSPGQHVPPIEKGKRKEAVILVCFFSSVELDDDVSRINEEDPEENKRHVNGKL